MRIALLSDIHNKTYGPDNEQLMDLLRAARPDVLMIAGDVNQKRKSNHDPYDGYEHITQLMRQLAAEYPVYYALGNHEYRWRKACSACADGGPFAAYLAQIRAMGVQVLINSSCTLRPGLTVTGIDLPSVYYTKKYRRPLRPSMIRYLVGRPDREDYQILLAHTPRFFAAYAGWGADLTLSGHLHGGMIRIPGIGGLFSPYRTFLPGFTRGLYVEDGHRMIVSAGLNPQITRVNNPPELVIITLVHREEKHGTGV